MPISRPARRLLTAVTVAATVILAALLTVTGAHGSTAAVPPSVPTGFAASSATSTSVTLTWTASQPGCCDITGYTITWSQAFDDIMRISQAGNVTTLTISENIRPATQYSFRVRANDSAGNSSLSSEPVTVVTPLSDTGADTTPPQAPAGLTVTGESATQAALSWSPSTDDAGVTGYQVYWFDGWFSSRLVATVSGTTFTAPLTANRNVFYVRARDAAGNVSIASNTVTVNTTGPTSAPPSSSAPPPPPGCRVGFEYTSRWDSGFVASVKITNTGTVPVDGWTLAFTAAAGQRITSSWNGTYVQEGAAVTVRNAQWNAALTPGATRDVGLLGTWAAPGPAPTAFALNGVPCTTG